MTEDSARCDLPGRIGGEGDEPSPFAVLLALRLLVAMCIRRSIAAAVLALTAAGCLPFLHPWATDRDVDGSYTQVFQATLEVLRARDFPIERADRDEGLIETGKRPVDGVGPYHPVETVRAEIDDVDGGDVDVRLVLTFLEPRPPSPPPPPRGRGDHRSSDVAETAVSRSAVYDDYLDAIERRVRDFNTEGGS
jgi:hypothetical protein